MNNECEGCSKLITICSKYNKTPTQTESLFCNDKTLQNNDEIKIIISDIKAIHDAYTYEMDMLMEYLNNKIKGVKNK